MLLNVFSVFDVKAAHYGQPFFMANRGAAQRAIQMQLRQDQSSLLAQYPADFQLYQLGTFDDDSGLFNPVSPQFIISVADLVEVTSNELK